VKNNKVKVEAFAKINFGLQIVKHLPDGYHEIETCFLPISLHDTLLLEPFSSGIVIYCDTPGIPLSEDNLIWKAASLFWEENELPKEKYGASITLTKQIPVGSGLGGGSSDAAATLKGLKKLWNVNMSDDRLRNLAARIGADVPFFLYGFPAFAEGKGEILKPFSFPDNPCIALVYPGFGISTEWAYKNLQLDLIKKRKKINLYEFFQNHKPEDIRPEDSINDFENPVFSRYPILRSIKEQLYTCEAYFASLSGSGSTVYGFFKNKAQAENCSLILEQKGYKVFIVRIHC